MPPRSSALPPGWGGEKNVFPPSAATIDLQELQEALVVALGPLLSEIGSLNAKMDDCQQKLQNEQQKQFANMANTERCVSEMECQNRKLVDSEKKKQVGAVDTTLGGQDLPEIPGGAGERISTVEWEKVSKRNEVYFTTKRSKLPRFYPRRKEEKMGVLIQKKVKMKIFRRIKVRRSRGIAYRGRSKRKKI